MAKKDSFKITSDQLLEQMKGLIHEGNVRKILIKDEKGKKTYLEIPATVGVASIMLIPTLALISSLAIMTGFITIEVHRTEGKK